MKKKLRINTKIKFKLICMFILLIIIPLSILGINSYLKSSKIVKQSVQESALEIAKQTNTSIKYYTNSYEESILQMSKDPNIQQIVTTHDSSAPWLLNTFKAFIDSHKGVQTIFIGTVDKKTIAYPEAKLSDDYDPTSRPWYVKASEKKSITWTEPYLDANTKKLIISVSAPVYNTFSKNELVGVVSMDISLDALTDKINSMKFGEKGYAIILDSNKNVLTHKDKALIGKPIPVPNLLTAIKEIKEGYVDYTYNEGGSAKDMFSAFANVDGLNWTVVASMYTDEITNKTTPILLNTLLIGVALLIIAILIALVFSNSLTKPLNILLGNINKIKEGDFTVSCHLNSNDEIGELAKGIDSMIDSVGGLIKNINVVSKEVTASSESLAATSEETSSSIENVTTAVTEISRGASEQAMDAEKSASLTLELSNKLNQLQNNTDKVLNHTEQVVAINDKGVKAIEDLHEKNALNESSIDKIEEAIIELDNKSKNINNILETISSISEQTNLLALNASIEASRAGEAGKGFAVVADEIRKLAEGSNNSVKEINEIVMSIQNETSNTVKIMKEVKFISTQQSSAVGEVNTAFDYIFNSITSITENIKSVSSFVIKINKDKEYIIESIHNISSVSEETAAASEEVNASMHEQVLAMQEVSKSAENLNEQTLKLNNEISKFKID